MLLEYAIQYKTRYARLLEINGLPDAPLAQDQFIYLDKGMRVTQLIAHDPSTPAPAVVPAAATSVYRPAEKTSATATQPAAAPRPAESTPQPLATATAPESKDYLKIATPAGEAETADEKPVNIADEVAVEEEIGEEAITAAAPAPAPANEFDRLKARFDRVVYSPAKSSPAPAATAQPQQSVTPPQALATQAVMTGRQFHTVKAGETAFGISKQYGITMKQLMELNNLNFEAIRVGQKLRVK